jgi:hypothetical protein
MYSINVFVTFSLSMAGMLRASLRRRAERAARGDIALFGVGLGSARRSSLVTSIEKFSEGGWLTLGITARSSRCASSCAIATARSRPGCRAEPEPRRSPDRERPRAPPIDVHAPTAAVMVGGYNGIGIHTAARDAQSFRDYFQHVVFVVGRHDRLRRVQGRAGSRRARGQRARADRRATSRSRTAWVWRRSARVALGTDPVDDLEKLCLESLTNSATSSFVAGPADLQEGDVARPSAP